MIRVILNRHALEVAITKRNLSHRELAEKIGFSRSHLSHIMTGRREPSPVMRRLILDYLRDYTFDDIFIIEDDDGDNRSKTK